MAVLEIVTEETWTAADADGAGAGVGAAVTAGAAGFVTFTAQLADLPLSDVTDIVAVPSALAVTFPYESTKATFGVEVPHVSVGDDSSGVL